MLRLNGLDYNESNEIQTTKKCVCAVGLKIQHGTSKPDFFVGRGQGADPWGNEGHPPAGFH